jgi:hypothetical protein
VTYAQHEAPPGAVEHDLTQDVDAVRNSWRSRGV